MNAEPFESDEAPFFPLIGFNAGMVDGAVALRFEFAACREHYEARAGETQQFVMSPDAAIEIGSALIEQGRLAQSGGSLV